ncbi:MAG: DinB family protein [Ginsengibacter sp.]
MQNKISGMLPDRGKITTKSLSLFFHVITHEFHHKGQIATMCCIMGYPPPDTDIIRIS